MLIINTQKETKKQPAPVYRLPLLLPCPLFVFIAFLCTSLYLYDFFQIVKTFQYIIAHCLYFLSRLLLYPES